jgi:DNA-binding HxlR family transcriptional regulator
LIQFDEGDYMGKKKTTERCVTVSALQKILSGKWKIEILYYISLQTRRFSELQRQIGDITQSTLTKQLRELEADGFISRYIFQEIPPKVEYSLTDMGKSFMPVLEHMRKWGEKYLYIPNVSGRL